ncbi:class I SAM-dependent methyltransferase [Nocardiopsis sp. ATB16-24]|uniref:class I SAM-dependent methyltransferase n=1 Tax=Nocardiopsis sp. ATB16-24 TaxID=3019555 RepID=UPI0025533978|nr:class I SAM-dependent methyltransferase [Nocardiopsis sp. ATB16-24]
MPSHPPNTITTADTDITFRPGLWSQKKMATLYDVAVIHGTYPLLWGCPWTQPARLYQRALRPGLTVLDIGPGSGFFLDRFAPADLKLHLLDRYSGSLTAAATRLARYRPALHTGDALDPLPIESSSVDLVILGMVLHCVRGQDIAAKEAVFDHINDALKKDGAGEFIGYTVLSHGVRHGLLGRLGLPLLNRKGVFANTGDSLTDLVKALDARFDIVELTVRNSVVLWQVRTR